MSVFLRIKVILSSQALFVEEISLKVGETGKCSPNDNIKIVGSLPLSLESRWRSVSWRATNIVQRHQIWKVVHNLQISINHNLTSQDPNFTIGYLLNRNIACFGYCRAYYLQISKELFSRPEVRSLKGSFQTVKFDKVELEGLPDLFNQLTCTCNHHRLKIPCINCSIIQ